jgi:hypothetical protein
MANLWLRSLWCAPVSALKASSVSLMLPRMPPALIESVGKHNVAGDVRQALLIEAPQVSQLPRLRLNIESRFAMGNESFKREGAGQKHVCDVVCADALDQQTARL